MTAATRRYHYLLSVSFLLGGDTPGGFTPVTVQRDGPIRTQDDLADLREGMVNFLAGRNPDWDRQHRGWRNTVTILAFSLLRVEVAQRGRWVLADWQPWGPLNP